jgi:hypothetical protein
MHGPPSVSSISGAAFSLMRVGYEGPKGMVLAQRRLAWFSQFNNAQRTARRASDPEGNGSTNLMGMAMVTAVNRMQIPN